MRLQTYTDIDFLLHSFIRVYHKPEHFPDLDTRYSFHPNPTHPTHPAMALVRDPGFWRRFSVAVKQDEEARSSKDNLAKEQSFYS